MLYGNAVTAASNVVIGGKAALHLVHGPSNLVATEFFTLSLICSVADAASTGVQLVSEAHCFSQAGLVGAVSANACKKLGIYTLSLKKVCNGNLKSVVEIAK